jgi:hypothetical protein
MLSRIPGWLAMSAHRLNVYLPLERIAPTYVDLIKDVAVCNVPSFPRVEKLTIAYHTLPSSLVCMLLLRCPSVVNLRLTDQQGGYIHVPNMSIVDQTFNDLFSAIKHLSHLKRIAFGRFCVESPRCFDVQLTQLSCRQQICYMELNARGFGDKSLTCLLNGLYTGLEMLIFNGENRMDADQLAQIDWARFTELRKLKIQLDLGRGDIVSATTWALKRLAMCKQLASLNLSCVNDYTYALNSPLDALADLPYLHTLTLSCQRMDREAFARFCARSNISCLILVHPLAGLNKSEEHAYLPLAPLHTLRNLRHLVLGTVYHFNKVQTLARLEPLYRCIGLETLTMGGLTFDHDVVQTLKLRLPQLTTIRLDSCIVKYQLSHIHHIQRH